MAESHQETRRSAIEDFPLEKSVDSANRMTEGRHRVFVLLAALLISVGAVAAEDGVQGSEFLDDLVVGFDFNEGQGATAHDVKKTGTNASSNTRSGSTELG